MPLISPNAVWRVNRAHVFLKKDIVVVAVMTSVALTLSAVTDTFHSTSTTRPPSITTLKASVFRLGGSIACLIYVAEDGSDDEDSYEAQLRQQDQHDFHMADIEAGHEERLRASGPYRIPPHLLESGVATPSRGNTPDPDSRVTAGLELPPIPPPPSDLTPFQREFTPMVLPPLMLPEASTSTFSFKRCPLT